jgi:hypothetical protein
MQARPGKGRISAERSWFMGLEIGGLIGLLVLIADVWAILNIVGSSASLVAKVIWIVAILVLPVVGLLVWLIAGPRAARLTA